MKRFISIKGLLFAVILSGAFLVATACSGSDGAVGSRGADGPQGAQGPAGEAGPTISFSVEPQVIRWPTARVRGHGFWLFGAGLETGQWFDVEVAAENPALSFQGFAESRQANDDGAFALGIEIRPENMFSAALLEEHGPISLRLHDLDTGALLATTTWILCGPGSEADWCAVAVDPIPVS